MVRLGPRSITRPRYITTISSHRYSTTARSCEMNSMLRPERLLQLLQQVQDLRLDRDVERRDRLVGDEELGLDGQARGRCRCAAAARRRTRAGSAGHGRDAGRPARAARRSARAARRPWRACGYRAPRRGCRATVIRGLRLENGSWKTICIRRRSASICAAIQRRRARRRRSRPCRPSARSAAARSGRRWSCPSRIRRPGPTILPRGTVKLTSSTACTTPPRAAGKCLRKPSTTSSGARRRS